MVETIENTELNDLLKWFCNSPISKRKRVNCKAPSIVLNKTQGRNDPCLCGSGKKYKKCCGKV